MPYSLLADIVGSSPRAIGKYMKANKTPIVIPCHRVVKRNGNIGGFSLGRSFKRKILELEEALKNGKIACMIDSLDKFWLILETTSPSILLEDVDRH